VQQWNLEALWPPALATPPLSHSPLSTLPPSQGAGSSHISPEFVESWTLTPGLPPVLLAPLNPLPSPVTLSQVEDVLTTSNLIREIHSCHLPPALLSTPSSPPSFEMAIDDDADPSPTQSHATSYTLWVDTHPAPTSGSPLQWTTWLGDTLQNEVPKQGLAEFIKMLSLTRPAVGWEKFVQNWLQVLANAVHNFKQSPTPGSYPGFLTEYPMPTTTLWCVS
jgi:hypothetical protein